MKKFVALMLSLLAVAIFGCSMQWNPPTPYLYEAFSKPGASETEAEKVLLECGFSNIFYSNDIKSDSFIVAGLCMERNDFSYKAFGAIGWCRYINILSHNNSCNNNRTDIPIRSVERRLKSPYCKQYPRSPPCAAP